MAQSRASARPRTAGAKSAGAKSAGADPDQALQQRLDRLKPHLVPIGIAVGVLVIIAIISAMIGNSRQQDAAEAYALFTDALGKVDAFSLVNPAQSAEKIGEKEQLLNQILTDHPGSVAAIDARYQLAHAAFARGKFQEAATGFAEFYKNYPNHEPLASMARLAEGNAVLAQKKFQAALDLFQALQDDPNLARKQAYIVTQAKVQAALCNIALGRTDEAKLLLEDVLAGLEEDSPLQVRISSLLGRLDVLPPFGPALTEPLPTAPADDGASLDPLDILPGNPAPPLNTVPAPASSQPMPSGIGDEAPAKTSAQPMPAGIGDEAPAKTSAQPMPAGIDDEAPDKTSAQPMPAGIDDEAPAAEDEEDEAAPAAP